MNYKEFPYQSVEAYLESSGVLENGTSEQILLARKRYRKLYVKHYQRQYNKLHSRMCLWFANDDKQKLQLLANKAGVKPTEFLKRIVYGVLEEKKHSVLDGKKILEIQRLLLKAYDLAEELQYEHTGISTDFQMLLDVFKELEIKLKGL